MNFEIQKTADGSDTVLNKSLGIHYHSTNGAITEAEHVFISAGFNYFSQSDIAILEVGFGTGLNAALTAMHAKEKSVQVWYVGLERYPLTADITREIGYKTQLPPAAATAWNAINNAPWNTKTTIDSSFAITKLETDFTTWTTNQPFDLIYFDAFAPDNQPEMWALEQFKKLFAMLNPNGVLVTYSAKGVVKQALRNAGFTVKRLQGPPGKHHMLLAIKE
ncbi:MAG: tRNA (5-methylaminomethyl-2-thiouridine)(34)-methyltransferase MnmD [Bacteroidales bacterium]|nr:tRNA (5-methylaminomethyl-2-thiouridine)(34)-methyltransferase MnmD [Bacteroidales bacterium]MBN2749871.1 tRNA (5-methylaminomethyl-2-thiouridine)(34)-methyltransferase MnmD [Bacteroidales bacterium]